MSIFKYSANTTLFVFVSAIYSVQVSSQSFTVSTAVKDQLSWPRCLETSHEGQFL